MHLITRSILFVLFIIIIASCGGGGDSGSNPPPPVANVPPVANAGNDVRALESELVTLNGSGDDSDGTISTISWVQLSGPVVTLNDADTFAAKFSSPDIEILSEAEFQITITDNDGATATDSVLVTLVPVISVSLNIEDGADVAQIISGSTGVLTPDVNNIVVLEDSGFNTLVGVVDSSDNLALMSLARGTNSDSLTINGLSTVEALMYFIPVIRQVYDVYPEIFTNSHAILPEVIDLASYISINPNWGPEQPEFEQLYFATLEVIVNDLDSLTKKTNSTDTDSSSQKVFHVGGDDLPRYEETQGRAKVTLIPEPQPNDGFKINIENQSYFSWIVAMITSDTSSTDILTIDDERTFVIPSESGIFNRLFKDLPNSTSTIITPDEYPTNIDFQDNYGVYTYAPALFDLENAPTDGQAAQAFWMATMLTVVFDYAYEIVPLVSNSFSSQSCLANFTVKKLLEPTGTASIRQLSSDPQFRQYIIQGSYSEAGLLVTDFVFNVLIDAGADCLFKEGAEGLIRKLSSKSIQTTRILLSRLNLLTTTIELSVKLSNAVAEQVNGRSERFFKISNTLKQQNQVGVQEWINAPDAGEIHYKDTFELSFVDPTIATDYYGDCVAESGTFATVDCMAYTFDKEPPYTLNFIVRCKHPITEEFLNCNTSELRIRSKNSNEFTVSDFSNVQDDGSIQFTYDVNQATEYIGSIITTDDVNGTTASTSTYDFQIQTKRAQPQVSIHRDGNELGYNIDNGVMTISEPIEISPIGSATSSNIELELVNSGYGSGTIDTLNNPATEGLVADTSLGQLAGIGLNNGFPASQVLTINYTPSSASTAVEDEIIIDGNLAQKSIHDGVTQNFVEQIVIPVFTAPPPVTYVGTLELIGSYDAIGACEIRIAGDVEITMSPILTTSGQLNFVGTEYVTWCDGRDPSNTQTGQSFTFPLSVIDGNVDSIYEYEYFGVPIIETATGSFDGNSLIFDFNRTWKDRNDPSVITHQVDGSTTMSKQ